MGDKSFIEVQFPVSKISKESYKERKSGSSQTLTGLGKWWGRKPLILVRATILGILMPSTDKPIKDREIFLKILNMDEEGLKIRKDKNIAIKEVYNLLDYESQKKYFKEDSYNKITYKKGISREIKNQLQQEAFNNLSYDEKLQYCCRPEQVNIKLKQEWDIINQHLGTNAHSIETLIEELGRKKFGRIPVVGDCFAGGGSIPFEASRIGCSVYASDLNPVSAVLNWANLNILSNNEETNICLNKSQNIIFDEVVKKIDEYGIETNELGWRAKSYLYCNEAICPDCGAKVPLLSSLIISKKTKTIAKLEYIKSINNYDIKIIENASESELYNSKNGTVENGNFICPNCRKTTSISVLRKDKVDTDGNIKYGLRRWQKHEFKNRKDDIFTERLYCIKYIEKFDEKTWDEVIKKSASATDSCFGNVHFRKPNEYDLENEQKIEDLLDEKFDIWQKKGYIPNLYIEDGYNTAQIIRERGWGYWHHLFNPRQLLILGTFMEKIDELSTTNEEKVLGLLGLNRCIDRNSKLCPWHNNKDTPEPTYANQALNSYYNYGVRTLSNLYTIWMGNLESKNFKSNSKIDLIDARTISQFADIWITDPPYADAVNYHELSEFFLAWDKKLIEDIFDEWYTDSKRILAIKEDGFNQSMIEVYSNLAKNMPDNGMQVVMFTHQDVKVWAELTLVLWASGLQVTSAWNIATETESGGLKGGGNYVKGTVLLVLRKQNSDYTAYLDELYPEIEDEVKYQIDSMRELDNKEDPNFTDADYLLAAYAASLKVLTSYKNIEDIDVEYELSKSDANSPIVNIINEAVKIAFDYLTPNGFDSYTWKTLLPEERFYIKGLDTEKEGVYKLSAYQELGRGFGVQEYSHMMANNKANQARLKTASELAMRYTNESSRFGNSVFRNVLIALYKSTKEEDATKGKVWIKNEVDGYWNERSKIVEILDFIATLEHIENMKHWEKDAKSAKILVELVKNDGV